MNKIEYGTEFLDQLKDSVHNLYDENKELQERINKAIEYIETNVKKEGYTLPYYTYRRVIKILKGEDNE